jgi:hypothetical protein
MRNSLRAAAILVIIGGVAGCGQTQTADPHSVPFTVVAKTGPIVGGINVSSTNQVHLVGATSVSDLRGLLRALGDAAAPVACATPQDLGACWQETPADSLLLAVDARSTCLRPSTVSAASLSTPTTLTLTVQSQPGSCLPGSLAQPRATFSLVALPLSRLPSALLTVMVKNEGAGVDLLPTVSITVDARRPLPAAMDEPPRMVEAGQALAAAQARMHDQGLGTPILTELGIARWADSGLGCGTSNGGSSLAVHGYRVVFGPLEFHWSAGHLAHCT